METSRCINQDAIRMTKWLSLRSPSLSLSLSPPLSSASVLAHAVAVSRLVLLLFQHRSHSAICWTNPCLMAPEHTVVTRCACAIIYVYRGIVWKCQVFDLRKIMTVLWSVLTNLPDTFMVQVPHWTQARVCYPGLWEAWSNLGRTFIDRRRGKNEEEKPSIRWARVPQVIKRRWN